MRVRLFKTLVSRDPFFKLKVQSASINVDLSKKIDSYIRQAHR